MMFLIGIIYANLVEYLIHRYLFHGLGKKKNSLFAFHLREHHLTAKRNNFTDVKFSLNEAVGIPVLLAIHFPLWFISPAMYLGLCLYGALFIVVHNLIHAFPDLGRKYFWWHWNHHMSNQNKSWAVVIPIVDIITGSLERRK